MLKLFLNKLGYFFDAGEKGAYYVYLEGGKPQEFWLICPDDFLSFQSLSILTMEEGFALLASYCENHEVPKWAEFIKWLNSWYSTLNMVIPSLSYIKIGNLRINGSQNPITWTKPNNISDFFRWIAAQVERAENENNAQLYMLDYWSAFKKRTPIKENTQIFPQEDSSSLNTNDGLVNIINFNRTDLNDQNITETDFNSLQNKQIFVGRKLCQVTTVNYSLQPYILIDKNISYNTSDEITISALGNKFQIPITAPHPQGGEFSLSPTLQI